MVKTMKIKMPSSFGERDEDTPEAAHTRHVREYTKAAEPGPGAYLLEWESGGALALCATEEDAYRQAAKHLMLHGFQSVVRGQKHEFDFSDDCDCCCHNECSCTGEHSDNATAQAECHFEDCGTEGKCCITGFDGKTLSEELQERWRKEDYQGIVGEWNNFWYQLREAQERDKEDMDEHEDYRLNVVFMKFAK
jgi:hypothetical protein